MSKRVADSACFFCAGIMGGGMSFSPSRFSRRRSATRIRFARGTSAARAAITPALRGWGVRLRRLAWAVSAHAGAAANVKGEPFFKNARKSGASKAGASLLPYERLTACTRFCHLPTLADGAQTDVMQPDRRS